MKTKVESYFILATKAEMHGIIDSYSSYSPLSDTRTYLAICNTA